MAEAGNSFWYQMEKLVAAVTDIATGETSVSVNPTRPDYYSGLDRGFVIKIERASR